MVETISLKSSFTNPAKNENVPPCADDTLNLYLKEISKIPSLSSTKGNFLYLCPSFSEYK